MTTEIVSRWLFPFGGLGAGARGFLDADVSLPTLGVRCRVECIGGIDNDPEACADFEYLTGAPAWCVDVGKITGADLVKRYGALAPDGVFMSPPCKGASGLLSEERAATEKYEEMNRLAVTWTKAMLDAWGDWPPRLLLLENVPRLKTRAAKMLKELRALLRAHGYVFSEGFHDCGELGGLAQRRRRFLLVARHAKRCPPILYQPPRRRVRGCGEVLATLPVPATPEAEEFGRIHELPRISWLNWVRLALIPAGGDWRDLEGVLAEGQQRREVFRRKRVEDWEQPSGTISGPGANGVEHVADPRVERYAGAYGVKPWEEPVGAVAGESLPSNGAFAVGDPRASRFSHIDKVRRWDQHVGTITKAPAPSSGSPVVADPRVDWFGGVLGVKPWAKPSSTITGRAGVSTGAFAVGDPRVRHAYDAGYAVLDWEQAARTIAGTTSPGCGAYAVADPRAIALTDRPGRHWNKYAVTPWEEPASTVIGATRPGSGSPNVADPRKPPSFLPVIVAKDGTWHRPLTTLELAALQGIPTRVRGEPLRLCGTASSRWRERIGNAVPPPTARAIAEQMLVTLAHAALGSFGLSSGAIWVFPDGDEGVAELRPA